MKNDAGFSYYYPSGVSNNSKASGRGNTGRAQTAPDEYFANFDNNSSSMAPFKIEVTYSSQNSKVYDIYNSSANEDFAAEGYNNSNNSDDNEDGYYKSSRGGVRKQGSSSSSSGGVNDKLKSPSSSSSSKQTSVGVRSSSSNNGKGTAVPSTRKPAGMSSSMNTYSSSSLLGSAAPIRPTTSNNSNSWAANYSTADPYKNTSTRNRPSKDWVSASSSSSANAAGKSSVIASARDISTSPSQDALHVSTEFDDGVLLVSALYFKAYDVY